MRRFSAKEDARRLTAAPLIAESISAELIGLENHLNYVYRPGGSLTDDEAWVWRRYTVAVCWTHISDA